MLFFCDIFIHKVRSRRSPQPPVASKYFCCLSCLCATFSVTTTSEGYKYDLALIRISLTLLITSLVSHCLFLWCIPLKKRKIIEKKNLKKNSIKTYLLPLSHVKYPWSFDNQNLQFSLQTLFGNVQESPVPIIIIVIAKIFSTAMNF